MRRPIKAHLINRSNRPVYQSKPVTHAILNLDLNSNRPVAGKPVKPTGIPVRTGWTEFFEFKFEFDRFLPVTGQTGPVYRNRSAPVWGYRLGKKTLDVASHVPTGIVRLRRTGMVQSYASQP